MFSSTATTYKQPFFCRSKSSLEPLILCHKYLNQSQIPYNSSFGSISTRNESRTEFNMRQCIFEEFPKPVTFPCLNKGKDCNKLFNFEEVNYHAKQSSYHEVSCFNLLRTVAKCSWQTHQIIINDYLKKHNENFLDAPNFPFPDDKRDKMYVYMHKDEFVIVFDIQHTEDSKYLVAVVAVKCNKRIDIEDVKYQINLYFPESCTTFLLRPKKLLPLLEPEEDVTARQEIDLKAYSNIIYSIQAHLNIHNQKN